MKSDDEKLIALFETKEKPTFNNTVKRAKAMSLIRNVIVSLVIFIIVSCMALILNALILNRMSNKEEDSLRNWYNIAMPNAYMGNTQVDDRFMTGQIDYVRYRFLGKKLVTDGSYKEGYTYMPLINGIYGDMGHYLFNGVAESEKALEEMDKYNKAGKKVMKFYHPSIKYDRYLNDLGSLDDIGSSKLIEVSLSFDKQYSLDEVKELMPEGVTLNWYWVDTLDKDNSRKSIFDEYNVYGIKALDNQGDAIVNPERKFIYAIMNGKEKKDNSGIYENLFNILSKGKGEIDREDLRIVGVVVSGEAKALKALKDKDYIKAATIGAVSDKY